ncbi:aldose 1-epimerase [Citrobacter portucalensis]|uniref:aldose 1-epimerase n=1 Tax=Citrobacter portucalensis TaxID=1639133 RepID=UPI00226BB89A|nr:aldose 1-epimerase [Citrobacter portucalensis]MCX9024059.1 aldose 1-epimerase [Citrobacter portucalensis]MCX9061472.1 aldose 1-epimerase [Citrobacter portucalensis]
MNTFTIENPYLRARITNNGACLLSLEDLKFSSPVLRPWVETELWHPGESAMFPMLPFANRISGNAFSLQNNIHTLPANMFNDPYYIHGNGWLTLWDVQVTADDRITFCTYPCELSGYKYHAEITYTLQDEQFLADVIVTHLGETPMPYGLGFHPFFMTLPESTIQFLTTGYWSEDENHLANEWFEDIPEEINFSSPLCSRGTWINNCYSGWNGLAVISHPGRKVVLRSDTPWLMVYQNKSEEFICLEPQTHQVDAYNLPGRPGLRMLKKGDSFKLKMAIGIY